MRPIIPVLILQVYVKDKLDCLHKTGIIVRNNKPIIRVKNYELNEDECLWAELECKQLVVDRRALANKEIIILMKNNMTPKLCRGDLVDIEITKDEIFATCSCCNTKQKIALSSQIEKVYV